MSKEDEQVEMAIIDSELGKEVDGEEEEVVEEDSALTKYLFLGTKALLAIGFVVFSIYAFVEDFDRALALFYLWIAIAVVALFKVLGMYCGESIGAATSKVSNGWESLLSTKLGGLLVALAGLAIILIAVFTAGKEADELIGLVGVASLILFSWITSWHKTKIQWRPVVGGIVFQFVFAFLILRTTPGFDVFNFLGIQVTALLGYSFQGASFVFGRITGNIRQDVKLDEGNLLNLTSPEGEIIEFVYASNQTIPFEIDMFGGVFATTVLTTVIFFSAFVSMLYYSGILQVLIRGIGGTMAFLLGTSASESLNAAGNIFVGQTEAPLLIRPFLKDMTASEIHAVMVGGFATIAGGVLGIYINFGVNASHLLSASVMSAPAALAISKLVYPETEVSKTRAGASYLIETGDYVNILHAASAGAADAIWLALNIGAQLIAFIALIAFANAITSWFGGFVGYPELTLEEILSYIFYPFAFVMGVDREDCLQVGELLGVKIIANEFVAFDILSKIKPDEVTQTGGLISYKSSVIATYALCGFSNFASIGIQLGGLTPLAPNKAKTIARVAFSAMVAGNTACFLTGAIAGLLFDPERTFGI